MTFAMPDRGLLTVREVAAAMRVSTMTVYRLIKAGELPAIRVGKHFRIKGGDLHAYLDSRIVGGPGYDAPAPPPASPTVPAAQQDAAPVPRGGGSWPGE